MAVSWLLHLVISSKHIGNICVGTELHRQNKGRACFNSFLLIATLVLAWLAYLVQ